MPNKNSFGDFFAQNDFAKLFENYQSLPFDMQSFMETQRKNIQAVSEAQQISFDRMQAIVQRQTEIMSQMVEDQSAIAKELLAEGTPEEKISKNADAFKKVYERSVKNMNELAEMLNQSSQEATKVINKRVSATMNEIKSSLEKNAQKTGTKKAA